MRQLGRYWRFASVAVAAAAVTTLAGWRLGIEPLFLLTAALGILVVALLAVAAMHRADERSARAERDLLEGVAMYRTAFEDTNVAMVLTDLDNRFLRVNAAFARMFGYDETEMIGMSMADITHPDDLPESYARREDLLAGRAAYFQMEKRYRHRDGHLLWGLVNVALMRDPQGQPLRYNAQIQDITERKWAEDDLRRASEELEIRVQKRTAELEVANKELEAFSYSVSHDLRAPLRAIDGFARILQSEHLDFLPPEGRELLHDIRANSQKMGQLVDDLLRFSRLSRQPIHRQTVDCFAMVRQCIDEMRRDCDGRQVEFHLGELPAGRADPALLKQVWLNLLSNAVKYTSRCPQTVVQIGSRAGAEPTEIAYFVKDNGVGFDMRYAAKLFGVFQRLHRAEEYDGTGVGLAIVQRIVHRHGGVVRAEAEPGRGATFMFTLGGGSAND